MSLGCSYRLPVKDFYEDLWERLPDGLVPADLDLRRSFALAHVSPGDRLLDLGCGTGDLAADLARAGAEVTGIEVAEAAVERARGRHPDLDARIAPIDGPLPLA